MNHMTKQEMKQIQESLVSCLRSLDNEQSETAAWLLAFKISSSVAIGEHKTQEDWCKHVMECLDAYIKANPFPKQVTQ